MTATAQTKKMSIPFTATRTTLFYDGVTKVESVNGHVNNVATDSMKVTYGQIVPLTTEPPEDDTEDETSDDTDALTKAHEAILGQWLTPQFSTFSYAMVPAGLKFAQFSL